jgi:hypothetical protein
MRFSFSFGQAEGSEGNCENSFSLGANCAAKRVQAGLSEAHERVYFQGGNLRQKRTKGPKRTASG